MAMVISINAHRESFCMTTFQEFFIFFFFILKKKKLFEYPWVGQTFSNFIQYINPCNILISLSFNKLLGLFPTKIATVIGRTAATAAVNNDNQFQGKKVYDCLGHSLGHSCFFFSYDKLLNNDNCSITALVNRTVKIKYVDIIQQLKWTTKRF